jgi:hypothetical protein
MKLDKVEVKPEDILPDISFYGETYHDKEQLPKIEDIRSLALEAIYRLGIAMNDTKDRYELSANDIYNSSEQAIKDIEEYLGDFHDEENVLTLSSYKDIDLEIVLVNNKIDEYRVVDNSGREASYWFTDFEEAINAYNEIKIRQ